MHLKPPKKKPTGKEAIQPVVGVPKTSKWTEESERLLLSVFKEVDSSKVKSKLKWVKIAGEVNKKGYNFTSEQCRLKVKAQKEKYERMKKKNNTSGESPVTDMDSQEEVFESFPDMNPTFKLDSGRTPRLSTSTSTSTSASTSMSSITLDSDDNNPTGSKKRKRPRRSVDTMTGFLSEMMEKREMAAEKRHKEKMQTLSSLIDVMSKLADKSN